MSKSRPQYGVRNHLVADREKISKRKRQDKDSSTGKSRNREFFVPSFAVRRRALLTPELREFHGRLEDYCSRKPYKASEIGHLGLLLLEQRNFIRVFHQADVRPQRESVSELAEVIKNGLGSLLKSKPRKLILPTGGIHVFGYDDRKIGLVPSGWRGFGAKYSKKVSNVEDGKTVYGANSQIQAESNLIIGAFTNAFTQGLDSSGDVSDIDTMLVKARTPHITIARKTRGGSISNDERANLSGEIAEFLCPEIELFDPTIYLRLDPGHQDKFTSSNTDQEYLAQGQGTIYVRRPHHRQYQALLTA